MAYLFLIPCLISCYYVLRGERGKAFLNVYIPCLICIPTYYVIRLPHMPLLSPANGALLPIGFSLLFRPEVRWRLSAWDFVGCSLPHCDPGE